MRSPLLPLALLAGCAVGQPMPVEEDQGDPLAETVKADGDPYCTLEDVELAAQFSTVNLPAQACHDRSSARLEIGESTSGQLAHEVIEGDTISLGCTLLHGEVDVEVPVDVEARVYRVPVHEGERVYAELGAGSRAVLDLLILRPLGASASVYEFVEHGTSVDVYDDGGDEHVHEKYGERFVVLRVRPGQVCANDAQLDFELEVRDGPAAF